MKRSCDVSLQNLLRKENVFSRATHLHVWLKRPGCGTQFKAVFIADRPPRYSLCYENLEIALHRKQRHILTAAKVVQNQRNWQKRITLITAILAYFIYEQVALGKRYLFFVIHSSIAHKFSYGPKRGQCSVLKFLEF
jgi:hypothetical protein